MKSLIIIIAAILAASLLTIFTATMPNAQTLVTTKHLEVSMQNQLLRGAILKNDFKPSDFLRDYRLPAGPEQPNSAYLAAYTARWYGYQVKEMSVTDLALEGVGAGATMGMLVGALGQTFGWWDEDKTWMLVGAMSALGAAYTTSKIDDPSWRFRLQWEDENRLTVPTK